MSGGATTEKLPADETCAPAGFDWAALQRRLDASNAALERRLTPGAEEERAILRTRARSLAATGHTSAALSGSTLQVVEFVLGAEHYGILLEHIREIHPLSEFTALPGTPAFVLGLVNVRGQIVSIIDIKKFFDLPSAGLTDLNKVILVQVSHMELGILADAIQGVRSIAPETMQPALPTLTGIRAEYLKGITNDPLVVLDVEKILLDENILVRNQLTSRQARKEERQ